MLKKTIIQRRNKESKGLKKTLVIIDECADWKPKPKLIKTWAELAECTSKTHVLDIEVKGCNGWVRPKKEFEGKRDYLKDKPSDKELLEHLAKYGTYLSTHTFYGQTYKWSTELLQTCGFNIEIANWDELGW